MIEVACAGYSSDVDEKVDEAVAPASPAPATTQFIVVPARRAPLGRGPLIFAMVALIVVLGAGVVYVIHRATTPPQLTPEQTVNEFLSSVFLAADPTRTGSVVCAGWSGQDAVTRTTNEVEPGAHVSWEQVRVASVSDTEASATARLGQRLADDNRPSLFTEWHFQLKNENGWRVCEAGPIGS
jgi:hypothetical protein